MRDVVTTDTWTEDRIEQVKTLWLAGKSASDIAFALGNGISRSAVIGKVHRLKLSRAAPARKPKAATVKRSAREIGNDQRTQNALAAKLARKLKAPPIIEQPQIEAEPLPYSVEPFIPEAQRLTLIQLNEHTCKWPIGDPLLPGFYFCGQHSGEGTPYCEFHTGRAYQKIEKKR